MNRIRHFLRDTILWAVLTGGIVAFVLGQTVIGLLLVAFAVWQFTLIYYGKGGLLVDQRWAAKAGKPQLKAR